MSGSPVQAGIQGGVWVKEEGGVQRVSLAVPETYLSVATRAPEPCTHTPLHLPLHAITDGVEHNCAVRMDQCDTYNRGIPDFDDSLTLGILVGDCSRRRCDRFDGAHECVRVQRNLGGEEGKLGG